MKKYCFLALCFGFIFICFAKLNPDDLMKQLEDDEKNTTDYTTATFKTTRLINGHTVENVGKSAGCKNISHRFGKINGGGYELFGLDNATMRMGLDYGITSHIDGGYWCAVLIKNI